MARLLPGALAGFISRRSKQMGTMARPALKAVKRLRAPGRIQRTLGRAGQDISASYTRLHRTLATNPPVTRSGAENLLSKQRVGLAIRSVEHRSRRIKKLHGMAAAAKLRRAKAVERGVKVGAGVTGVGAAIAGAHVASYKVNKQRAQQGKGPSYLLGGLSGTAGYRAGMTKSSRRR